MARHAKREPYACPADPLTVSPVVAPDIPQERGDVEGGLAPGSSPANQAAFRAPVTHAANCWRVANPGLCMSSRPWENTAKLGIAWTR